MWSWQHFNGFEFDISFKKSSNFTQVRWGVWMDGGGKFILTFNMKRHVNSNISHQCYFLKNPHPYNSIHTLHSSECCFKRDKKFVRRKSKKWKGKKGKFWDFFFSRLNFSFTQFFIVFLFISYFFLRKK